MPELGAVKQQKTAGFINPKYNRSEARKKKLEQEEQELEELIKQSSGKNDDSDTGDNSSDGETDLDQKAQKREQQAEEDEHSSSEKEKASQAEKEEKLSPEEASFKKRYGDLRRYMQQKEKEWEEKLEAVSKGKSIELPASDEDIKAWQEKYPQVAKIIETVAHKKAKEMFDKADARLKEFDDLAYEAEREKSLATIRKAHDDFDELRESQEFHDWADDQPKWVRDALYVNEDDPKSVIRVIDLYKVDKGITKGDKKRTEKEAAFGVLNKTQRTKVDADESGRKIKESQVAKMSMKEYEKREEEINEAIRSGNFIYDLSGGAR